MPKITWNIDAEDYVDDRHTTRWNITTVIDEGGPDEVSHYVATVYGDDAYEAMSKFVDRIQFRED